MLLLFIKLELIKNFVKAIKTQIKWLKILLQNISQTKISQLERKNFFGHLEKTFFGTQIWNGFEKSESKKL